MAAMKLYFGENPVGGEVDLAEFDRLKTDVEGKYDKGDPSGLDGGAMQYKDAVAMESAVLKKFEQGSDDAITDGNRSYADAAAMEMAVKGNAAQIAKIHEDVLSTLDQLGSENIILEFDKYFPKYSDGDAVDSLMYESAAEMSVIVQKNEADIIANKTLIADGDAATLQSAKNYADAQDTTNLQAAKDYADAKDTATLTAANTHSDTNDAATLQSANEYTDDAIAAIDGIDGLEEFEKTVEELDKNAIRNWNSSMGIDPGTSDGGVTNVAVRAKMPDTPDPNTLYIITG